MIRHRPSRHPCDYPSTLDADGTRRAVRFVNVSAEGARLSGVDDPVPQTVVSVDIGGQYHPAQLRWQRGGDCGIRFERPLSARELAMVRQAGGAGLRHGDPPDQGQGPRWSQGLREMGG